MLADDTRIDLATCQHQTQQTVKSALFSLSSRCVTYIGTNVIHGGKREISRGLFKTC